jgi:hypothetical protein
MNAQRSIIIMLAKARRLVKEKVQTEREIQDNGGDEQLRNNNDESVVAGPLLELLRQ